MRHYIKTFAMATILVLGLTAQAMAADLADMKARGQVGEQLNGLIGIVISSPSVDVQTSVEKINDERLATYKDVADKNNIDLSKVQAMAGAKLISQTTSGQYIMTPGGTWVRK